MIAQWLWIAGSAVYILLAGMHLLYTFFTDKFSVRDSETEERMKRSFPVLTDKTTMWKAWTGFNGSHAAGGIFFGVINLYLAAFRFSLLSHDFFLLLLSCLVSLFYLFLGSRYWFVIPRTGILAATLCFITATIIILLT